MPILGLGTWKSAPNEVYGAVKEAIKIGYRHIDCAAIYGNEQEVGRAVSECIAEGIVSREDLWITSKLWNNAHGADHVIPALKKTLADLQLDYLDLYLIHWPVPVKHDLMMPAKATDFYSFEDMPLTDTWKGMEAAYNEGLTKNIGVSNFGIEKLQLLLDQASVKPSANQVELHPYLSQNDLVDFCHANNIFVTAYSPLGSSDRPEGMKPESEPVLLEDPTVNKIADSKGVTPAQVLLSWVAGRGISVIPKSVNPGRLKQNLAAAEVSLSDEESKAIDALNKNRRYIDGSFWVVEGGPHTIESLWA
ncbi:MAG: aldo/keto reductase [Bacteroidota bacterium]